MSSMKNFGRAFLRSNLPTVWSVLRSAHRLWRDSPQAKVFSDIYQANAWGSSESRSGPGSTRDQTEQLRLLMPGLLRELGVRSMLDAPCGDLAWMREVELPVERYVGADLVPSLVQRNVALYGNAQRRFIVADIITDPLPTLDLILCRDCLVHFSDRRIRAAIRNFRRSGATFLLTTTFPDHGPNASIVTGDWQPLNLERPPFEFPPPLQLLREGCTEGDGAFADKALGLWRLADL
jgi:hypothetical protein